MDIQDKKERPDESLYVQKAFDEFKANGFTHKRCLRCDGILKFEDFGNSFRVSCTDCDMVRPYRGI